MSRSSLAEPAPTPASAPAIRRGNPRGAPRGARAGAVADAAVLIVALGLALVPLLPVYGLRAAVPPIVGGLVLGAIVALVASWRRWGVLVTTAVAIGGYLLAGGALAAPTTTMFGVLPTVRSLRLLLTGAVTVWKEVLTLDPSLGGSGNLLAAPFLLAFVGAVVSLSIAARVERRAVGAWAAAVAPTVLALSVLLGTKEAIAPVVAGIVLAGGLAAWIAWRRGSLASRRVVALLLMGAVVATSGAVVGPLVAASSPRYVLRDEIVPPFDPRDQASPLSSFRTFIKDWKKTDLLTVHDLPKGATIRLATMDAYDGVVWNVAGAEAADGSGQFRRVGETITTSVRGARATVGFDVASLPFGWLPTVGYAERFTFAGPHALDLADELRYNDATGTAVLPGGIPGGTTWTAEVVVPVVPDDDQIGSAGVGSVRLPEPTGVPDAVPLFAGEIAGTATSPVLIARSLASGLAERGWFSHGLTESGDYPSLSGHGANRLTTLLTADLMVGDGEQYASAMALMARAMGLPARVVLGFIPSDEQQGKPEITVTGADIRAWVEINFAGQGWVPFMPTPDESKTPRDDTPKEQSEPQPQVMQPPPPPEDPVKPPDDDTELPQTEDTKQQIPSASQWQAIALVAAEVTVPLALLLTPLLLIGLAKRRRRRSRRSTGTTLNQVTGGWDEVMDTARDLRCPPPPTATRREVAVHVTQAFAVVPRRRRRAAAAQPVTSAASVASAVGGPLAGLAAGADAIVFGPGEPNAAQVEAYWAQVDGTVEAMRRARTGASRWRARFSTASLRARRRARRAARSLTRRTKG